MRTLWTSTTALLLIGSSYGCAAGGGTGVRSSTSDSTSVFVDPPRDATPPDEAAVFEQIIADHVAERGNAIDACYLSEALSGRTEALATYELSLRVQAGTKKLLVRRVSTSDPDQPVLENCIRDALTAVEIPRRQLVPPPVRVTIRQPDWLSQDARGSSAR